MKTDLLELVNEFLATKDQGPVPNKTYDLFDAMDSLDYVEFICWLEQKHGIKIVLPVHGVHFNFNRIETVERLERYVENIHSN